MAADENIHEALARLEQALIAERRHRREAEAMLAGLRAIATAPSLATTDPALLRYLQSLLGLAAAALLAAPPPAPPPASRSSGRSTPPAARARSRR